MKHLFSSVKVRILIGLILIIIIWQVVRNWPDRLERQNDQFTRASGAPVLVMVYYEALCPDSKNFILKQLQTVFYKASTLIDYQLIPYGKATTSINKDGSLKFECQHGPTECQANTYHACVIEAIDEPKILLDVVSCMINDNMVPKEAMLKCTKEHRVDWEPIQKCFDSPHGAELLKLHGEATHALKPAISFIPTVTLDGSQGHQALILKDLASEICKIVRERVPKPDICLSLS